MTLSIEEFKKRFGGHMGAKPIGDDSSEEFDVAKARENLEKMLVRTGRAKGNGTVEEQRQRAEASAGVVLEKMEKATQDNQKEWNAERDKEIKVLQGKIDQNDILLKNAVVGSEEAKKLQAENKDFGEQIKEVEKQKFRLTHAVSGHGKDTDQLGRVLHGRRNDELKSDLNKPSKVNLTSDNSGPTVDGYTTVGSDPSNTSGAFTTNQGMLHAVTEAFAQADMVNRHSEQVRAGLKAEKERIGKEIEANLDRISTLKKDEPQSEQIAELEEANKLLEKALKGVEGKLAAPKLDDDRFATTVETDQDLGYNLEVSGAPKQEEGRPLQPGELQERFKQVKRTDHLQNATVVLDPGYVRDSKGKLVRAGWNLQTAFAHNDASMSGSSYANAEEVRNGFHQLELDISQKSEELKGRREEEKRLSSLVDEKASGARLAKKLLADANLDVAQENLACDKCAQNCDVNVKQLEELNEQRKGLSVGEAIVQDVENLAKLSNEELLKHGSRLKELSELLDTLYQDCQDESSEEFIKPVLSGREADSEVYVAAARLLSTIDERVKAQVKLDKAKQRKRDHEEAVSQEDEKLAHDKSYTDARRELKEATKAVEVGKFELLQLRKRSHDMKLQHEDLHGAPVDGSVAEGYDPKQGQYTGDRPEKPSILKGVDEEYDPLTAHHLYPWNKIVADLNKALSSQSKPALQKLFRFGEVDVPDEFWIELAKPSNQRSYVFTAAINLAAQQICWSPNNIFMGPIGDKRGDDPGEALDATYTSEKEQTLQTRIAHAMAEQGGISARVSEAEVAEDLGLTLDRTNQSKIRAEIKKRQQAAKKVEELFGQLQQAETERRKSLQQQLDEIKQEDKEDAGRLSNAEVREDLAKSYKGGLDEALDELVNVEVIRRQKIKETLKEDSSQEEQSLATRLSPKDVKEDLLAKFKGEPEKVPFKLVDAEIARREKIARKIRKIEEALRTAPKEYNQDEWKIGDSGKKEQIK